MGRFIVKLKEYYLEWSTVVEAPITYGMTLDELKAHIKEEYGSEGMRELPLRLAHAQATGTSAMQDKSAEDTIWLNRAGEGERPMTILGIYHVFCLHEEQRDEWLIPQEILDLEEDNGERYAAALIGWPEA